MTVAVPSEPANYFHLLRRHALDGIQRPLVVFTPKSMLRNRAVVSPLSDFTGGRFRPVIDDPRYRDDDGPATEVRRVLLCSGKIYYELAAARDKRGITDTAIVRHRAALPGARPPAGQHPGALPERRGHPLGPGGAGQPGRLAVPRAGAAGEAARGWSASSGSPGAGWPRPPPGSSKVHEVEQDALIDAAFSGDDE